MAPVVDECLLLETCDVRRELGGISRHTFDRLVSTGELEPTIVTRSGRRLFAASDVERVSRQRRRDRSTEADR